MGKQFYSKSQKKRLIQVISPSKIIQQIKIQPSSKQEISNPFQRYLQQFSIRKSFRIESHYKKNPNRLTPILQIQKNYVNKDTSLLKYNKNHKDQKMQSRSILNKSHQALHLVNNKIQITKTQLDTQIKKTKIVRNGNEYHVDMYVLKKARDICIKSMQRPQIALQSLSQARLQEFEEQNNVYERILKKRQEKHNKLIQSKNMNWNVYYDLCCLSSKMRQKVQGQQRFASNYGLVLNGNKQ